MVINLGHGGTLMTGLGHGGMDGATSVVGIGGIMTLGLGGTPAPTLG